MDAATLYPEKSKSVWGDALVRGAAARDPQLAPLEVVAGSAAAVGEGVEQLRELSRPSLALYVGGMGARGLNFYNDLARRYGFEAEAERIQDLYLDGKREEAARAVPDEFLEKTTLIGPPGYVRERIAAFREAGVTVLNLSPVGGDPVRIVEQVRELADA